MHEQLKVYEEKMQKTMKSLDSDLAGERILTFWTG